MCAGRTQRRAGRRRGGGSGEGHRWRHIHLTLEEVGRKFKVTRERIRQLQNIALSKMRKAIHRNETQLTKEEIEVEDRQRQRMEVIREFIETRSAKPATSARN